MRQILLNCPFYSTVLTSEVNYMHYVFRIDLCKMYICTFIIFVIIYFTLIQDSI